MGKRAIRVRYSNHKQRRLLCSRRKDAVVKKALEFGINGNEVLLVTRDIGSGKITIATNLQENLQVMQYFLQNCLNKYVLEDGHMIYNPQLIPGLASKAEIANTQKFMKDLVCDTDINRVTLGSDSDRFVDEDTGCPKLFLSDKRFDGFVESTEFRFDPELQQRMVFANSDVGATTIVSKDALQHGINNLDDFLTLEQQPNYHKEQRGRKRKHDPEAFPGTFPKRFKPMIFPKDIDHVEINRTVTTTSRFREIAPDTPIDSATITDESPFLPKLPKDAFPSAKKHIGEEASEECIFTDEDINLMMEILGSEYMTSDNFVIDSEKSKVVTETKTVKVTSNKLQQTFAAHSLKRSFTIYADRVPEPQNSTVTITEVSPVPSPVRVEPVPKTPTKVTRKNARKEAKKAPFSEDLAERPIADELFQRQEFLADHVQ